MTLNIQLIDKCNLACKMCNFVDNMKHEEMSIDNFTRILEKTEGLLIHGKKVSNIRIDGNGEPLLYKEIKTAILEVKKRFPECRITTNGTLLTEKLSCDIIESGLSNLVVSVTGITSGVYKHFQGYGKTENQLRMQFNNVVSNVERFAWLNKNKYNNAVNLQICYCLSKDSLKDAAGSAYFWKEKGVNSIIFMSINSGLGKVKETYDKYIGSTEYCPSNICFETISILSNGDVCVCCNDSIRASTEIMGNIYETDLKEMVNSNKYRAFVDSIRTFDIESLPSCCQKCDLIRVSVH